MCRYDDGYIARANALRTRKRSIVCTRRRDVGTHTEADVSGRTTTRRTNDFYDFVLITFVFVLFVLFSFSISQLETLGFFCAARHRGPRTDLCTRLYIILVLEAGHVVAS